MTSFPTLKAWNQHLMDATKEPIPDLPTEERPASTSRILASILIGTVLVLQILITGALLALLIRLNAPDKNSPVLAATYVGLLRAIVLWSLLFDTATALSLYGINVWKYISTFASPLAGILPTGTGVVTRQDLDGNQKTVTLVNEDTTESSRCD